LCRLTDINRALLTPEGALSHLHAFCQALPQVYGIENRLEFKLKEELGLTISEVHLPLSLEPSVRIAKSHRSWETAKAAKKDAAFHAYEALYRAGLVNDNLLPISHDWNTKRDVFTRLGSTLIVQAQIDPFTNTAAAWESPHFHQIEIRAHSFTHELTVLML
jgi:hypothetical protein